jgi:ATP synthase in type III secretion protein N
VSGGRVDLGRHLQALPARAPLVATGRVVELTGLVVRAIVDGVRQGDLVEVRGPGAATLPAEVVGFRGEEAVLLPLGGTRGLAVGAEVVPTGAPLAIRAGPGLLGRVLDGLGRPIDGRPLPAGLAPWAVERAAPGPLARRRVTAPLALGVRALDALLTAGEGQRIGLFAGSGVGKSTLLGQIARGSAADVVVVGLVGERGREVRDFLEVSLGPEGLARGVVVAATSDAPALVRLKAAHVATALAEWFAEVEGRRVLLLLDSVTRFARAQREVGLAAGEPPARQGYPPSVFSELPRLLERTGNRARGGITAVYTVLVAGGDLDEPIADEVRGILDGHVVLDRSVAERGRFPAVDVLQSVSRVMSTVATPRHRELAARIRGVLAVWERQRDLVSLGAYAPGSDPATDEAIARIDAIEAMLRQGEGETSTLDDALAALEAVLA